MSSFLDVEEDDIFQSYVQNIGVCKYQKLDSQQFLHVLALDIFTVKSKYCDCVPALRAYARQVLMTVQSYVS